MSPKSRSPTTARAVQNGDRRALARLISQVENRDPAVRPTLEALYPHTGHARIVGLTGPLGVGKSSLINALVNLLRHEGERVGVVAVDPSSPFSGGSVLGDRIRIERASGDDGVFVRSMASRGHAGGVAAATCEVARLLDAAGYGVILVETVGSGQVDLEIRGIATTSVVVLVPHLGDEVQTLKAGLFEIADVFCVNKSDLPGAEEAAKDLRELVGLGPPRGGWRPAVVTTTALGGTGVADLWRAVDAHEGFLDESGTRHEVERRRAREEILGLVRERLDGDLSARIERDPEVQALIDRVAEHSMDPRAAADHLYRSLRRSR